MLYTGLGGLQIFQNQMQILYIKIYSLLIRATDNILWKLLGTASSNIEGTLPIL